MQSKAPLILGIDLGTTSIKVALVTHCPNPRVEKTLSRDIGIISGHSMSNFKLFCLPNEHTQDVGKIFQCLHLILSSVPQNQMSRVTAITVTGQMHGVVGWLGNDLAFLEKSKITKRKLDVDVSGGGCGNLITWMDRRCDKNFLESLPYSHRSQKPFSGFGCATILWHLKIQPDEFSSNPINVKQELEAFEKVAVLRKISVGSSQRPSLADRNGVDGVISTQAKSRSVSQCPLPPINRPIQHVPWTCVGTIADFLVAGLASLKRPVMSPQMAMSWGYFDADNSCWDLNALNATGFNLSHLLPEIVPCGTEVGKLTFDWEGVPAGASVYVALGDLQCSVYPFLEHQKDSNGVAACNISTSAQIAFKMPTDLELTNGHESPSNSSSTSNICVPSKSNSIFETLLESKRIDVWPFFKPGEKIVVAASMNGGNVIERFVKMLRVWCRQLGCPAVETAQIYEKLSHAASHHLDVNGSPRIPTQSHTEMIVDPRLFEERYDQASPMESSGGSVVNIHPDDMCNLPAVYAAVCSGVIRNLVSMAPPELMTWANIKELYCMGGAMKRNPLLVKQLITEYSSVDVNCLSEDQVIEACVGAALYTATAIEASKSS